MRGIRAAEFTAAARIHAIDVAAATILLLCASVMAGRVWRFPFDDEVFSLVLSERASARDVLSFSLNSGELHPPLPHLLVYFLHHLGLGQSGMRLCSIAMTAAALGLFHLLTLALIVRRSGVAARLSTRLAAVLLFGLSPLAIGQGDAIRWYPMFALLFALFCVLYLTIGERPWRIISAVPLGLAASTNFLAAIVVVPLLLYRHLLERRFRLWFELSYWSLFSVFASLGIAKAYSVSVARFGPAAAVQLESGPVRAVATEILGFLGGDALGVSQGWVIVPVVLIAAFAMLHEIDRKAPANAVHLLLLMFAGMAFMAVLGFAKPRSFLYLAPVLAVVLTLFVDRQSTQRSPGWIVLLVALLVVPSVAAIANINHGTRPFKRSAVIPYEQILDFIRSNEQGDTLIVSSDPVVVWSLNHRDPKPQRCVSYFFQRADCLAAERRYDSIFVISGQSSRSRDARFMRQVAANVAELTAGRRRAAQWHAGLDEDAALKTWLTGVALDEFILTVELYR